MATYISLVNLTDQGARSIKDSPDRANAFKAGAEKLGVSVKAMFYTVGQYDLVLVVEGAEEAVVASLAKASAMGNVRSNTLRAFSVDEMKKIVVNV
jgi:uncharacterized protein with GYD domain